MYQRGLVDTKVHLQPNETPTSFNLPEISGIEKEFFFETTIYT
jgi:hypothetical protein